MATPGVEIDTHYRLAKEGSGTALQPLFVELQDEWLCMSARIATWYDWLQTGRPTDWMPFQASTPSSFSLFSL